MIAPPLRSVEEWAFQILNLPWADKFNIAERQHVLVGILRAYAAAQVARARAEERELLLTRVRDAEAALVPFLTLARAAQNLFDHAGVVLPDIHAAGSAAGEAWRVLWEALAHPAIQRAVKETP
jgi:hypothetical protein